MLRNWISCLIVELQDLRGHKGLRVCKDHQVLRGRLDLSGRWDLREIPAHQDRPGQPGNKDHREPPACKGLPG
jgi:hypothetical protein